MKRRAPTRKSGGKRNFRRVFAIAALAALAAYAGLFAFGLFCSDLLIYKPPKPAHYDASLPGLVKIPLVGGGEIAGLWIPGPRTDAAILCFHGNSDDLGNAEKRMRDMAARTGCPLLAIDYPGYGLSPGKPSEAGVIRAADAAFAYLERVRGFAPETIVVRGLSLGTGPAMSIAARRSVKGLILDAPYTSTFRTVTRVKLLPFDKFDNLALADRVRCPVLVIHGDRDRVVPFSQGRELADAMTNAVSVRFLPLPGKGHEICSGTDASREEKSAVAAVLDGRRG